MESLLGEVTVLSDAFERREASEESFECIQGRLTGQSKGLKRPTFYREGGHSGIIITHAYLPPFYPPIFVMLFFPYDHDTSEH